MSTIQSEFYELANNASKLVHPPHPYYPLDASIVGYLANETSVPHLLTVFFGACAALFTTTYFVAKRIQPTLSAAELVLSLIHI